MRIPGAFCLTVLAGACSSVGSDDWAPDQLDVRSRFAVDYDGRLGTALGESLVSRVDPQADLGESSANTIAMDVRLVRMSRVRAARLFGDGVPHGQAVGGVPEVPAASTDRDSRLELAVPVTTERESGLSGRAVGGGCVASDALRAAIDELIAHGQAHEVDASQILLVAERWAHVSSFRQLAVLNSFRIASSGTNFVAAPMITTTDVGYAIDLRVAEVAERAASVECAVRFVDLVGEPHRIDAPVVGENATMALQVPLTCRQQLRARAAVAVDEAMFLSSALVPGTDEVVVVLIEPDEDGRLAAPR